MAPPRSVESWATQRLESMGVDGVFAPYVIGMLADGECDEEVKFSVHQVLMGWLSPEDEDRALDFVEDLVKFHRNPSLVPPVELEQHEVEDEDDVLAAKTVHRVVSNSFDDGDAALSEAELKASAPRFVPHYGSASGPLSSGAASTEEGCGGEADADYELHGDSDSNAANGAATVDVMQDEDTFFWSVAFDLVGHLQLKFPDIDPTRLCDLLKIVELDVDKAHAVLKATLEKELTGTTQVCRHYLAGDCRRADCMFVHDTHVVTCRFWLRGMCMQDDNCVFAHDFTEVYALDLATTHKRDYDSEDEGDDDGPMLNFEAEEMFPSLGSAASTSAKSLPRSKSSSNAGTGSSSSWGSPSTSSATAEHLSLNFARAVSLQASPPPSSSSSSSSSWFSDNSYAPSRRTTSRPLYHKTAEAMSGSRWLTTGEVVAQQYKQLRDEAYELACARNRCFMQATRAYQTGNRSLARSLSTQGHELNVKMKRCHFRAASQIFESRNPKSQLYSERLMDLHGLHVAEAVEFLAHMLPILADDGLESVSLVTGSGHHSKGATGNARLLPAVERFLSTEGYQFVPVADRRGHVGMLLVDLRW